MAAGLIGFIAYYFGFWSWIGAHWKLTLASVVAAFVLFVIAMVLGDRSKRSAARA
jgi:hypothetical protein